MSKLPVTVATIQSISIFLVTYSFAKYPIFVHSTVPFTYLSIYLNFQSLFHFFINAFIHFSIFYHFQIYLLFYSFFSSGSLFDLCCCCTLTSANQYEALLWKITVLGIEKSVLWVLLHCAVFLLSVVIGSIICCGRLNEVY